MGETFRSDTGTTQATHDTHTSTTMPQIIFSDDDDAPKHPTMSRGDLIEASKAMLQTGFKDGDMMADDFQFKFPIVELDKSGFLAQFPQFDLDKGFPDMENVYYGFRLDPVDVGRVWVDARAKGPHPGTFNFGRPIAP